ncbi:sensor histidine kinase [Flavobacterium sp. PL002]|uniref:sensor histidine kinase n=1 Tax=Flavobacterium sp. PL002 TaxID=1897058 RepID=UPI001787BBEF|nr:sensor histidine kinase [Flavobacterium sp. PL002]MBE0391682.1 Sensor histidine kinase YehU [Flavobacterium sp. PL002]
MNIEKLKNNISSTVLIHVIIWGLFMSMALIPFYENSTDINADFFVQWVTGIALFYLNYYYLVPNLLLHKKAGLYITIVVVILLILMTIRFLYFMPEVRNPMVTRLMNTAANNQLQRGPHQGKPPLFFKIIPTLFYIFIIAASTVIRTLTEYHNNEQNKLIMESNRTASELNYLRKQTNPHFLFNALNSIYSLAYKKSDLVPDAIVTLSEMMRYMLYETDNQTVFLEKEINYIKNYLELQKLRLNNIENIYINIHGETREKYIEPLLLISFVENAFKYGTDYKGAAYVKIKISIENDNLDFWIENKIQDYTKDPDNSGIGMNNIENRLDLLYPNSHQLTILETDGTYTAHLKLKLDQLKKTNT